MGLRKETIASANNMVKLPVPPWKLKEVFTYEGKSVAIYLRPNEPELWLWEEQLDERDDGVYCRSSYIERQSEAAARRRKV